jgi:hypothetical protein
MQDYKEGCGEAEAAFLSEEGWQRFLGDRCFHALCISGGFAHPTGGGTIYFLQG